MEAGSSSGELTGGGDGQYDGFRRVGEAAEVDGTNGVDEIDEVDEIDRIEVDEIDEIDGPPADGWAGDGAADCGGWAVGSGVGAMGHVVRSAGGFAPHFEADLGYDSLDDGTGYESADQQQNLDQQQNPGQEQHFDPEQHADQEQNLDQEQHTDQEQDLDKEEHADRSAAEPGLVVARVASGGGAPAGPPDFAGARFEEEGAAEALGYRGGGIRLARST